MNEKIITALKTMYPSFTYQGGVQFEGGLSLAFHSQNADVIVHERSNGKISISVNRGEAASLNKIVTALKAAGFTNFGTVN